MKTSRRRFVTTAAAAAGAAAMGSRPLGSHQPASPSGRASRPLRILILGGTGFTGPHQVNYAVERGHQVTVFNRGRRQADIPDSVEHLTGDRNAPDGVAALKGTREWDVAIDIPTTNPRWVRDAAGALAGRVGQYLFVSTISTYANFEKAWMDETAELAKYEGDKDPFTLTPDEVGGPGLYGALKVLSEQEAEKWFPGKTTIIRPGLIVGPGDPSNRFTYWPVRIARGGDVMVPGDGTDPVQIIDARDLSEWVIRLAEGGVTGIYNATGPRSPLTMAEMVAGIRAAISGDLDATFTWVPSAFLGEQKVNGWSDMPVWVPSGKDNDGWSRVSIARALSKGLRFRPLADTARATLDWHRTRPAAEQSIPRTTSPAGAGLSADREAAVLAAWRVRKG